MNRFAAPPAAWTVGLLVLGSAACQAGPSARAASQTPGAIVAQGSGLSTSTADLDKAAEGKLLRLRQQEYEIKKQVLDDLIGDALMAKEAKARGVSVDDLLKKEVDEKVKPPTKE